MNAFLRATIGTTALILAAACGETEEAADEAQPEAPPASAPSGDQAASGPADQQFLREMSDHHNGLVQMAHEAMEKTGSAVQQEATTLDQKQDEEIEEMLGILLRDYSDPHTPVVMPDAQAMAGALEQKTGADYDMTFRMNVIEHHKQGIAMIDRYLPQLTREDVRAMAQRMKADQENDIRELEAKMTH